MPYKSTELQGDLQDGKQNDELQHVSVELSDVDYLVDAVK